MGQLLSITNAQKKTKHKFDNKSMKETLSESIIENTTNHNEKAKSKLKANQLESELKTVALEWKPSRNMEECGCSTTFDAFNKKVYLINVTDNLNILTSLFTVTSFQHHCWSCGDVLCTRCMAVHTTLPGHLSQRAVPICKSCCQNSGISSTSP